MKPILLIAGFLAVGCGAPTVENDTLPTCTKHTETLNEGDAKALAYNFDLARQILTRGAIPPEDFCALFAPVTIRIRAERAWVDPELGRVVGTYVRADEAIEVGNDHKALFHEMLHRWERTALGLTNSGAHPDWQARGLYALDQEYRDARFIPFNP